MKAQQATLLLEFQAGQTGNAWPDIGSPEAHVVFEHPNGRLYEGDSLLWLQHLPPGSVDLIFADPPYNIGKADWDDLGSHDEYVAWSLRWIEQAARLLKPHGSL